MLHALLATREAPCADPLVSDAARRQRVFFRSCDHDNKLTFVEPLNKLLLVIPAKADCGGRPKNAPAFSAFPPSMAVRRRSEHSRSVWPEGRAADAASQSSFFNELEESWIPACAGMTA
jgi:hypothetical protein